MITNEYVKASFFKQLSTTKQGPKLVNIRHTVFIQLLNQIYLKNPETKLIQEILPSVGMNRTPIRKKC